MLKLFKRRRGVSYKSPRKQKSKKIPLQRKTTLKWGSDGELSSIDMARVLDRLAKAELTECDLACNLKKDE